FGEVWGIDVSPSMIDLARKYNPRCKFHLNVTADLEYFPDRHFDLVYSFLVLQHLPNESLIYNYLREFIRVLRSGGLAVFQIPERLALRWRLQPRRRIYRVLHSLGVSSERLQTLGLLPMSLIAIPEETVEEVISAAGATVRRKERLNWTEGIMY